MIRSNPRSFTSFLAAAAAMCLMAVSSAFARTAVTIRAARSYVVDLVLGIASHVTAKFEQPSLRLAPRAVELVQACAYALRLAKRERPHVRDTWRMCPST